MPEKKIKKTTTSKKKAVATEKIVKEKKMQSQSIRETLLQKKKKVSIEQPLPFEVESYIFYPQEGLGFIKKLEYREFDGQSTLYYEIFFESQKMISHIPVKNAKMLRLRKVISKTYAQKVLKSIASVKESIDLSWKDRLNLYQEILKKGNSLEMAEIVSVLYSRRKIKPLSFQERQYYEFALESLVGEIAVAFGIEKEQAKDKIHSALELSESLKLKKTNS